MSKFLDLDFETVALSMTMESISVYRESHLFSE